MVAGNGDLSIGQQFVTPAVGTLATSSPGLQNANVITMDIEDGRCEGYDYSGYGFFVPATANLVDTLLTKYDPDVPSQLGYDSITNLTLTIHYTQHAKDTTILLADYNDPRFGTASGDQEVTYPTEEFGCDSIVLLRVYRLGSIADETRDMISGQDVVEVTMNVIPEIVPDDFFSAGGTLTPTNVAPYTANYPIGQTTPVNWTATIADSSAIFINYVTINDPTCTSLHPRDGSGNTYDAVRILHDCWLKTNVQTERYADGTTVADVHTYPGVDPAVYGRLYSYDAATGHYPLQGTDILQGVCPDGWHIPTYDKVVELMQHFEAVDLMSETNWINAGNNSSGFAMQPGGYYTSAGNTPYQMLLVLGYFWTYTPGSSIYYACEFGSACGTLELIPASAIMGYSVRCIKD